MKKNKPDYVEKAGGVLICFLCAIMLIGGNAIVFTRLANVSLPWADEILRACFIWTVFIGCAFQSKNGLVNINFFEEYMAKKGPKALGLTKAFYSLVNLIFAFFCCWSSFQTVMTQINVGERTTALGFPAFFITLGFTIGTGLWGYYEVRNIILDLQSCKEKHAG